MGAAIERMHERLRDQRGLTLVELVVAMAILSIVVLVFTTTLTSLQRTVVDEQVRSDNNDEVRLAIQSIDRQVRSGNLLYDPTAYQLRIYTQSNKPTLGEAKCVLWEINTQRQLVTRSWPQLQPENATPWQVVAEDVVNRDVSPAVSAFSLDTAKRTITVKFLVNTSLADDPGATQTIQSSLTGRNTSFGYPSNVCQTLPT